MKKIGILLCDTGNPFWRENIALYSSLATAFGFDITMRFAGDSSDVDQQRLALLRMAKEDYDAVIINPLTNDNLLPALLNLPFPAFDVGPKCDPEKIAGIENYFPIPVTDFEEQGLLAAETLSLELRTKPNGSKEGEAHPGIARAPRALLKPVAAPEEFSRQPIESACDGWALILGGFCDARQSSLRCRGAFKAFRKAFAPERILTVYANFNREDAFRTVRGLARKLDLRAVFGANDLMALGAIRALQEISPDADVPVGGVDAIPEALEALENGSLLCTVRLPHEAVVNGVYQTVSGWFEGTPPPTKPIARSVLVRRH